MDDNFDDYIDEVDFEIMNYDDSIKPYDDRRMDEDDDWDIEGDD